MTFEREVEAEALNHFQTSGAAQSKIEVPWRERGSEHQNVPKYKKQEVGLCLKRDVCSIWVLIEHDMKQKIIRQRSLEGLLSCYLIYQRERYTVFLPSNSCNSLPDHIELGP